ncbi:MAG: prolyl oligopeptidase family serine peptidase, partial [Proteobacteria bacterium]|nr:prolyl oligopeptidase family serine peptidase [Pseudomonadota bacterium]
NPNTPPTFIAAAADDDVVPVANSIVLFGALKKANVPVELHIFEHGGHGFGVAPPTTAAAWPALFQGWRDRLDPTAHGSARS